MNFSTAIFAKPFNGFESKYQGNSSAENPIAIPGELDRMAGEPGYDPNLLAGIQTSVGNPLLIWFPRFISDYGFVIPEYYYNLSFRLRNIEDANADPQRAAQYHLDQRLKGVPDDPAQPVATARFVLPVCTLSVNVDQLDSTNPYAKVKVQGANVTMTSTSSGASYWQAPLVPKYPGGVLGAGAKPGYAGILSQGQFSDSQGGANNNAGYKNGPSYAFLYLPVCPGDELIITASKTDGSAWDFTNTDAAFSKIFGTANGTQQPLPNTGIAIMYGMG